MERPRVPAGVHIDVRVLEFPLADIKRILDSPDFDRGKVLGRQIGLLEMKREHIGNLID